MKTFLSPSILNVPKEQHLEAIKTIEKCGAEFLHFDVMDGKFVKQTSFTAEDLKAVTSTHRMVNDVHLMIAEPEKHIKEFVEAGAQYITFHYEACNDNHAVHELIHLIHEYGIKAGMSIKPNTTVEVVDQFINHLDLVLVMSVEPGLGGQKFLPSSLRKISHLRQIIDERKINCFVEVDGGINYETGKMCKEAGADILVAGSYLFGHDDIEERIKGLKE